MTEDDYISDLRLFHYGHPIEEVQAARRAAVAALWEKHSMLRENAEEIVEDVLRVALPYLRFYPLGDNHHRADACPYCTPGEDVRR